MPLASTVDYVVARAVRAEQEAERLRRENTELRDLLGRVAAKIGPREHGMGYSIHVDIETGLDLIDVTEEQNR